MAIEKVPIEPTRIRKIPAVGFSWIDRDFLRLGYIQALSRDAILLYFFLTAASDAEGLSFYADPTIRKLLKLDQSELLYARGQLVQAGLIAYRYPLYQVLALPDDSDQHAAKTMRDPRGGPPQPIGKLIDGVLTSLRRKSTPADSGERRR